MSVEFRGVGGLGQIGSIKKSGKAPTEATPGASQGADQVQFFLGFTGREQGSISW